MKYFIFSLTIMASTMSFASEVSCNQEISREPYCVSKATAKEFCRTMGKNPDTLLVAKKCFVDTAKMVGPDLALQACIPVIVEDKSDPTQNESNCGQQAGQGADSSQAGDQQQ